jgi:hypothetical protein
MKRRTNAELVLLTVSSKIKEGLLFDSTLHFKGAERDGSMSPHSLYLDKTANGPSCFYQHRRRSARDLTASLVVLLK